MAKKRTTTDKRFIEAAIALLRALERSPNANDCRRAIVDVNEWRCRSGVGWAGADARERLALAVCREMGVDPE